jgi:hypothetical protein
MKFISPAFLTLSLQSIAATPVVAKSSHTCSSPLEIVREFTNLLDNEKKYDEAASFLDDDFKFVSPKAKFDGKDDWLQRFPKFHKNAPSFEEVVQGTNENEVTRKGKKKIGMMNINMMETFEVNDHGKIVKISAAMAK